MMSRMHGKYLLLCLCCLVSGTEAKSSLQQAWQSMWSTHPVLRAAEAKVQKQKADLQTQKSGLWPQIDMTANYQLSSEKSKLQMEMDIPALGSVQVDRDLGDYDRAEVGMTARYALFTGFAQTYRIEAQTLQVEAQEQQKQDVQQRLGYTFWKLVHALESVQVEQSFRRHKVSVQWNHWQLLKDQWSHGVVLEAEVLGAQADWTSAVADTTETFQKKDSLCQEFKELTGVDYDEKEMHLILDQKATRPEDTQQKLASRQKESLLLHAQALDRLKDARGSTRYPMLSAYVGYRLGDPGLNQSANEWMGYGVMGFQFQWNLFDGFERRSSQASLQAQQSELRAEADRIAQEQMKRVHVLDAKYQASKTQEQALFSALAAAQAAKQSYRNAVDQGALLNDDLLEAEIRVANLESKYQQFKIQQSLLVLTRRWQAGQPIGFDWYDTEEKK